MAVATSGGRTYPVFDPSLPGWQGIWLIVLRNLPYKLLFFIIFMDESRKHPGTLADPVRGGGRQGQTPLVGGQPGSVIGSGWWVVLEMLGRLDGPDPGVVLATLCESLREALLQPGQIDSACRVVLQKFACFPGCGAIRVG